MTEGTFEPDSEITREQLVTILYRYASYKGYDVTATDDLSGYTDAGSVNSWALPAMQWAVASGCVSGMTETTLGPQGTATRAQMATIMMRFCETYASEEPGNCLIAFNQQNATVTEIHQSVDGTYSIADSDSVENITYTVVSENYDEDAYGEALIDESEHTWSISDVRLYPGENAIEVTITTSGGSTSSAAITLTYDSGSLMDYEDEDLTVFTDEQIEEYGLPEGSSYATDIALVILDCDSPEAEREETLAEICNELNGTIVGQLNSALLYQIQISAGNFEALLEACNQIEEFDNVLSCIYDLISPQSFSETTYVTSEDAEEEGDTNSDGIYVPNDPWKDMFQGLLGQDWNEESPSGLNWWAEAIHLPSAWSYNSYFKNTVKVGVVDTGIDSSHEDLSVYKELVSDSVARSHGTHVAGVIGATANNEIGITGIAWKAEIISYDIYKNGKLSMSEAFDAIVASIEYGAKVVNFSSGYEDPISSMSDAEKEGKSVATVIKNLLKNVDHEFIIVQAAGNDKVNTRRSGGCCSVTSTIAEEVGCPEVMDHIFIVAAASKPSNGSYTLWSGSNFGYNITIAAPGVNIFSTVVSGGLNGNYGKLNGTSMAAPMVTGTIAMLWSVDPSLTASEIKEIITSTATTEVSAYYDEDIGTYYLLDADAALEEVIRRMTSDGTITGRFVDAESATGLSVNYDVHEETSSGDVVYSGVSSDNGEFSFTLEPGTYVIEVNGDNFITCYTTVIVEADVTKDIGDIPISTEVDENTYRIVLEWGATPSDLDSHLSAYSTSGEYIHICYWNMDSDYANLDVDDTSSYGPETITVTNFAGLDGFSYAVHNYSDRYASSGDEESYNLANSGAIVKVYQGNTLLKTYTVPVNKAGTLWNVFEINSDGTIIDINTLEYDFDPSGVEVDA